MIQCYLKQVLADILITADKKKLGAKNTDSVGQK